MLKLTVEPHRPGRSLSRNFFLAALAVVTTSCAYKGSLEPMQFAPGRKAAVTVALSYDALDRISNFTDRGEMGDSYTFSIREPLAQSLESLLARHFENVVTDDPEAYADIDFIVKPAFRIRKTAQRSVSYRAFEADLGLLFVDPIGGDEIERIVITQQAEFHNPQSNVALDVLNGVTLLIFSPFIIPTQIQNGGEEANRVLSEAMQELLSRADQEIARSRPRLARSARSGAESRARAAADSARSLPRPKSKYDDLLDAVIVITVSNRQGSGFFINGDGFAVTNSHVVGGDDTVTVRLRSGRILPASVVDRDEKADLALIRVDIEDGPFISLGDHDNAGIGTDVIAIGTPLGLDWSVSEGIVSAIRYAGSTVVLQTDAAINKGNSGGPLVNLNTRKVIGVNTFMLSKAISEGLNFAVSVSEVRSAFSYLKAE